MELSKSDLDQLNSIGITVDVLKEQLQRFAAGYPEVLLDRACTAGDGIEILSRSRQEQLVEYYESERVNSKIVKFVPASGAASRMFKHLHQFDPNSPSDLIQEFFDGLDGMPFASMIENASGRDRSEIISYILGQDGLGYGDCPKGMVHFHAYGNNTVRTAFEEHLFESVEYGSNGSTHNLHFTVPQAWESKIREFLASKAAEHFPDKKFELSFSIQRPETDTVAVNLDNSVYRDEVGSIKFRPGGHGALIHNLNDIDADVIFIKNVDNVVPDSRREEGSHWKSVLAGFLLEMRSEVFHTISLLNEGKNLDARAITICDRLGLDPSDSALKDKLNRPLRVCGMVNNEGEPGGGPYWVRTGDSMSCQIIEMAQIDTSNARQERILGKSTHFNPVDLVCSTMDYQGSPFDLNNFIDHNTGFITEKSIGSSVVKALELPGLWNGAMANWLTLFVEVPIQTFNPVKTVNDLLRPMHQNQ